MAWAKQLVTVSIEKLVYGGQGLGRVDNKVYFVWNALPGEVVEVQVVKKKKNFCEGFAVRVLQSSTQRTAPVEAHYDSCSPWQILSPRDEQLWKVQLAKDSYYHLQTLPQIQQLQMNDDLQHYYGYRNKIEYSFTHTETGELTFAFFKRGTHWRQPIELCQLASPAINRTAITILAWLKTLPVTDRALKSLIILSNEQDQTVAALFVRDEDFPVTTLPKLDQSVGFTVYFSNPRSPAAVPTTVLAQTGTTTIISHILGNPFTHDVNGFFQVNIPIFEQAVQAIQPFVAGNDAVVDFYGGVGSISLPLRHTIKQCLIVDSNVAAITEAQQNCQALAAEQFTATCAPAEKMTNVFARDQVVIVDPPRAGLHDDVTAALINVKPKRIIYLSCNVSTQARDLERLLPEYQLHYAQLFNFFPRTPHIEGLCVLDRNTS